MDIFRIVIWTQAIYILITAVWPILDISSFMAVTGPKEDIWLVKTVGALLIPVSITLFSYLTLKTDRRPALLLGSLTAAAFASVDFYFVSTGTISKVYLLDGAVEFLFLTTWVYLAIMNQSSGH